ncbi:MAG: lipid-A-disaccharide synthase [Acidobacteriota bacterium]|nr:lipid-A-disaccharide synthase [Acidobacteriota bacterium]
MHEFSQSGRHPVNLRRLYTGGTDRSEAVKVFLSAGEASGDHYGAMILRELQRRLPAVQGFGLGGLEMAEAGMERVVRAEDVAVMGITEVIRHMPHIYGEYRRLVRALQQQRPAVAVLIDFPDVNLRLARKLKALQVPVVYFVSPQLWAWKRGRLRWVQERVDRMMVIFPFEEEFYRARGVRAEFVGHPLAELPLPTSSREEFAQRYGLDADRPWVALLPGSRRKEVLANLPEMLTAAQALGPGYQYLLPVASTLPSEFVAGLLGGVVVTLVDDARAALHHARGSVVASGTATVQAAVIGNPFVVVYRVSRLTYQAARRLVRYPAEIPAPADEDGNLPIAMVNLIAGRRVVPELLQERFTGAQVAATLLPLLQDSPARRQMLADLAEVRARLQPAESNPIERVCDTVEGFLRAAERVAVRKQPGNV